MNKTSTRQFCFLIILICITQHLLSQKQANSWYFGVFGGLTFSNGIAVPAVNGKINTTEGTSSISDSNGNLLFYTEGVNVWDSSHTLMPNGTGLLGDVSTTQSALIVKKPGSNSLYYIFTLPAEGSGDFCYSEVDMTLNNGLGDVTSKNNILKNNVTEKLSGVYHCNSTDIWVMTHELGNNAFYAYLVTAAGVGTAVVSNSGPVHSRVYGQMKFNNKGTMIACARDTALQLNSPYNGKAFIDLHNFDNKTGAVTYSLSINLNNWQKSYGVEFSPDNTKLYANYYDQSGPNAGNSEVIQYNLSASVIASSGVTVGTSFDPLILRAMQVGPDGKIYVSKSNSPFLCVIKNPNAAGISCNYVDNAINIDSLAMGAACMLGLPNFVQSYFHPSFPDMGSCPITPTINPAGILESVQAVSVIYLDHNSQELKFIDGSLNYGVYEIQVFDVFGKEMLKVKSEVSSEENQLRININNLPDGLYFTRVAAPHGLYQGKFIK